MFYYVNSEISTGFCAASSAVLAWLGLKATGFGLALSGLGLPDLQAKPMRLALAWLWLGLAQAMAWEYKIVY